MLAKYLVVLLILTHSGSYVGCVRSGSRSTVFITFTLEAWLPGNKLKLTGSSYIHASVNVCSTVLPFFLVEMEIGMSNMGFRKTLTYYVRVLRDM